MSWAIPVRMPLIKVADNSGATYTGVRMHRVMKFLVGEYTDNGPTEDFKGIAV